MTASVMHDGQERYDANYARKNLQRSAEFSQIAAVDFTQLAESIKAWGNELGFQDISIADAGAEMTQVESGLLEWLSKGYHGEMDYMAKHGTRRTRPAELVPGTLRVISARMNYMSPAVAAPSASIFAQPRLLSRRTVWMPGAASLISPSNTRAVFLKCCAL